MIMDGSDCDCDEAVKDRKFKRAEEEVEHYFGASTVKEDLPEDVRKIERGKRGRIAEALMELAGLISGDEIEKATVQLNEKTQAVLFMGKNGVKVRRVDKIVREGEAEK
jgi:hypothetical protein